MQWLIDDGVDVPVDGDVPRVPVKEERSKREKEKLMLMEKAVWETTMERG